MEANKVTLDHTKYIGKSSSDPVSKLENTVLKDLTVVCRTT